MNRATRRALYATRGGWVAGWVNATWTEEEHRRLVAAVERGGLEYRRWWRQDRRAFLRSRMPRATARMRRLVWQRSMQENRKLRAQFRRERAQ